MGGERIRILRVIARLNMGGPAHQVCLLSGRRTAPLNYETLLVHGSLGIGEGSLEELVSAECANDYHLKNLVPQVSPRADAAALRELVALIAEFEPDIVHTHTAKAGFLGRQAALIAGARPHRRRPVLVHTFHGHVLEGYFGRAKEGTYRQLERWLARHTDRLIGVSAATVDDLVRLRIARPEQFSMIPLGLDLGSFEAITPASGRELREELGVADHEILISFVGRIVSIKRVDVLLRAVDHARAAGAPVRLAVAGDGELREEMMSLARGLGILDVVSWLGYRRDLPELAAAADIAVLSSDNEGTPVSLIEAGASGLPAVSTNVGGVGDVVRDGVSGILVAPGDHAALGAGISALAADPEMRRTMGMSARAHVLARFSVDRLIDDVAALYAELLEHRREPADPRELARSY